MSKRALFQGRNPKHSLPSRADVKQKIALLLTLTWLHAEQTNRFTFPLNFVDQHVDPLLFRAVPKKQYKNKDYFLLYVALCSLVEVRHVSENPATSIINVDNLPDYTA
jgi:hypothetical protein